MVVLRPVTPVFVASTESFSRFSGRASFDGILKRLHARVNRGLRLNFPMLLFCKGRSRPHAMGMRGECSLCHPPALTIV